MAKSKTAGTGAAAPACPAARGNVTPLPQDGPRNRRLRLLHNEQMRRDGMTYLDQDERAVVTMLRYTDPRVRALVISLASEVQMSFPWADERPWPEAQS